MCLNLKHWKVGIGELLRNFALLAFAIGILNTRVSQFVNW